MHQSIASGPPAQVRQLLACSLWGDSVSISPLDLSERWKLGRKYRQPEYRRSRVRFLSLLRYKAGSALPSWRTAAYLLVTWGNGLRRFGTAAECLHRCRCELGQPGSTGQHSRLGRSSCTSQLTFSCCPSGSIKIQFSSVPLDSKLSGILQNCPKP